MKLTPEQVIKNLSQMNRSYADQFGVNHAATKGCEAMSATVSELIAEVKKLKAEKAILLDARSLP